MHPNLHGRRSKDRSMAGPWKTMVAGWPETGRRSESALQRPHQFCAVMYHETQRRALSARLCERQRYANACRDLSDAVQPQINGFPWVGLAVGEMDLCGKAMGVHGQETDAEI